MFLQPMIINFYKVEVSCMSGQSCSIEIWSWWGWPGIVLNGMVIHHLELCICQHWRGRSGC